MTEDGNGYRGILRSIFTIMAMMDMFLQNTEETDAVLPDHPIPELEQVEAHQKMIKRLIKEIEG